MYEVFRLAAEDPARRGLTRQVSALLRAGHQAVREFLSERYGVSIGPRRRLHATRPDAGSGQIQKSPVFATLESSIIVFSSGLSHSYTLRTGFP